MKKIIASLFTLVLLNNLSNSQFTSMMEVPTPAGVALYSGCEVQGADSYPWIWVCGANGTIYKGRANITSLTWLNRTGNLPNTLNLVTIAAIDTSVAFVGGNSGSTTYIYKTSNGGYNWVQQFSQPNGYINAVWMRNALTGFTEGNPVGSRWSLWRTTNGGTNWDSTGRYLPSSTGETGFNNSLWCNWDTLIFGTNNSKTYFSSNFGINWISQPTGTETNIYSIYWDFWPYPSTRLFAGSSSGFLNSSDFGMNWLIQQNVPGIGNILGICSFTGGVAPLYEFFDLYTRSNKIYIGQFLNGNWQLAYTAPSGNYTFLFQKRNEPPPNFQGFGVIVGVRDNGGVSICFGCRWGGIKKISDVVPNSFILYQNYPNPFNPATGIKFSVPRKSVVTLTIYNSLGVEISKLINEELAPGVYLTDWPAPSGDASNYPSGVYFYQLTVSSEQLIVYSETKRMVLLK